MGFFKSFFLSYPGEEFLFEILDSYGAFLDSNAINIYCVLFAFRLSKIFPNWFVFCHWNEGHFHVCCYFFPFKIKINITTIAYSFKDGRLLEDFLMFLVIDIHSHTHAHMQNERIYEIVLFANEPLLYILLSLGKILNCRKSFSTIEVSFLAFNSL